MNPLILAQWVGAAAIIVVGLQWGFIQRRYATGVSLTNSVQHAFANMLSVSAKVYQWVYGLLK